MRRKDMATRMEEATRKGFTEVLFLLCTLIHYIEYDISATDVSSQRS